MSAVECTSPKQAVDRAIAASGCATAICWRGTSTLDVHLGASTAFGPSVRSWQGVDRKFVDRLIGDTVRAAAGPVFVCEGGDAATAMAAFSAQGPKVPFRDVGGRRTSMWWTSARVPTKAFVIGDVLRTVVERSEHGWDVRYRAVDGRDAGLHVRLAKRPDPVRMAVVEAATAQVERFAYGSEMDVDGGEIRTQLLVLSIPHALAAAFPEGKLPRMRDADRARSA